MPSKLKSQWIEQAFKAKAVKKGSVIRRSKASVHKIVSLDLLMEEVLERGFHLVETGDQYVIICNKGALTIQC